MPSVFKPVAHLGGGESGGLRQLALLARVWVGVLQVPLPQKAARPLLKAVRLLLAIPNGTRQWKLLAHAILIDGSEWASAQLLGLLVVGFEPHGLQLAVRFLGELVILQDVVQLSEAACMVGDHGASSLDSFVLVDGVACAWSHRQGPKETAEALDVTRFLQGLTHAGHLLGREAQCGQLEHGRIVRGPWARKVGR